jgi:hypothetical protein
LSREEERWQKAVGRDGEGEEEWVKRLIHLAIADEWNGLGSWSQSGAAIATCAAPPATPLRMTRIRHLHWGMSPEPCRGLKFQGTGKQWMESLREGLPTWALAPGWIPRKVTAEGRAIRRHTWLKAV